MGQCTCRSKVSEATYDIDGDPVIWSHVLSDDDCKKWFSVDMVYKDKARLNYKKRQKYRKNFQRLMSKIESYVTVRIEELELDQPFNMYKTLPAKSNEHLDMNEIFDGKAGSKRTKAADYNSDSSDEEVEHEIDEHTTIRKTICFIKPESNSFIPIHQSPFIDIHKQRGNGNKPETVAVQKGESAGDLRMLRQRTYSTPDLTCKQLVNGFENKKNITLTSSAVFSIDTKIRCVDSGYSSKHDKWSKEENHYQTLKHVKDSDKCRAPELKNCQQIENKIEQFHFNNEYKFEDVSERNSTRVFHATDSLRRQQRENAISNSKRTRKAFIEYYTKLLKDFFKQHNLQIGERKSRPITEYDYVKKFDEYLAQDYSLSTLRKRGKEDVFKLLSLGVELTRYDREHIVYPIDGLQKYFEEMSVPVASRPPHSETMKYEWVRVRSFWSFPSNIRVSPLAMARVGFYYTGKSAECRCFSCGAVHREWRDGDDPYVIHQQISPNCFYLNGQESGNVPIHEEDRLRPRHHVDQTLVSTTALPRTAAEAEAIFLPGLSSAEIAGIPVPSAAGQGRSLGTSQSGDFSFKPQSSQAGSTTEPSVVNQGLPSNFTQPPQGSQNVGLSASTLQSSDDRTSTPQFQGNASSLQGVSTQSQQQFGILPQGFESEISGETTATRTLSVATANIQLPTLITSQLPTDNVSASSIASTSASTQPPSTNVTSESTQSPNLVSGLTGASTATSGTASTGSTRQQSSATNTTTSSTNPSIPTNTTSSTTEPPTPTTTTTTTSSSTGASSNTTVGSEPSRSRFDPLGINFEKPRYPAYAVLTLRVNTYNGWPSYLDQTPRTMAKAGFFYAGYGDYTRCFFCGGGLRNWEAGDDPWVEHARWFPKCAFLRQNRGDSFVNMVQTRHQEAESSNQPIVLPRQQSVLDEGRPANIMASIPVQTLREMGKDDTIITEAIDRWRAAQHEAGQTSNYTELQATEIYEIILQIESERNSVSTTEQQLSLVQQSGTPQTTGHQLSLIQQTGTPQSTNTYTEVPQTAGDTNEQQTGAEGTSEALPAYLEGFDKVLEEYEEQKERLTCKICKENPVAVAFLPCGHLVCCLDCAPAMRKCPVCHELVKGTIKTFFP